MSFTSFISPFVFVLCVSLPYKTSLSKCKEDTLELIISLRVFSVYPKNTSCKNYIEYVFDKYSSNFFLLISLLLPHHNTKLQFSSFVKSLNLFIPIPKYFDASSKVRFDFSHIGTSLLIKYIAPFHEF